MTARSVLVAIATGARVMAAARGTLVMTAMVHVIIIGTMASLWRAAAEAGGGAVAGYSATALVWYIVATEAAVVGVTTRLVELIGDDIASGAVTAEMLRPASVVGVRLATEPGRSLVRLAVGFAVGATLALVVVGPPPDAAALALALPSLCLAVVVNHACQHAFAGLAFWVRDIRSTWFLYQKLVFILGGMLIPLEVLPDWLAGVARVLPFSAMAYAPGRLAAGFAEPHLLVVQAAWVLAAGAPAVAVFAAGQRRVQAVGG